MKQLQFRVFQGGRTGLVTGRNRKIAIERACEAAAEWIQESGDFIHVKHINTEESHNLAHVIVWYEDSGRTVDAG